jgi:hypothetical protein
MLNNNISASELIDLSIREDRIVRATYSDVLHADLFTDCDDDVVTHDEHEYWGEVITQDEAGDDVRHPWRVHLVTE